MGLLVFHPRSAIRDPLSSAKAGSPAEERPTSRERIVLRQLAVGEWQAKAGIIVSKKLSKKSTERNKLKRRLRAALVRVLPELSDLHLVVLPTRRAMGARVEELEEELRNILKISN